MALTNELYAIGEDEKLSSSSNEIKFDLNVKPLGILLSQTIQHASSKKPLKALFDSGSDKTFINRRVLPAAATPKTVPTTHFTTINGDKKVNQQVTLRGITLPEFSPTKRIDKPLEALVMDSDTCPYDIIIGLDFMVPVGIDLRCATQTMAWDGQVIPWKPRSTFTSSKGFYDQLCIIADSYHIDNHDALATHQGITEILESKYDEHKTSEVASQQKHLNRAQQRQLAHLLAKYTVLFNGKLGVYPHQKIHLTKASHCRPFAQRPYPIAHAHRSVFKNELDRLVEITVLSPTGPAKYLSPSFIIPKKDGRVRWITDFRKLNSMIERQVYHLPKIQDILKKRSGYKFFTKLDISMQYYTFELDDESKELCTICTTNTIAYQWESSNQQILLNK